MYPRLLLLALAGLLLAGCGSTSASSSTSTPISQLSWSHAPRMQINRAHSYSAVVRTDEGTFTIHLLPRIAPVTVNNFVFLARQGFYNHVLIHRIIKDFMFQTGDPTGTGAGGPGYLFKNEKVPLPYTRGIVAMANSGLNRNGSQFFVMLRSVKLQPNYTIFGKVTSGWSTLNKIAALPVTQNPGTGEFSQPVNDVYVERITIHETA